MFRTFMMLAFVLAMVAGGAIWAQPAQAQQGVIWNAEYFNNPILSAPPTIARQESAIAFNWGAGSPGSGVNADGFSARFGSDPTFAAGTYRFYAQADDAVRVTIDYANVVIDTFNQAGRVGQLITGDLALGAGLHHIQIDYREDGGDAYVYFSWANLATNPTGPNFSAPVNVSSSAWTAQYFTNQSLLGVPVLVRTESSPTNNWGANAPAAGLPVDNFSVRWTSTQTLQAGNYQLSVSADDGVRVFVNGIAQVNAWSTATGITYNPTFYLPAGQHNFMVEYFEAGGNALLNYQLTLVNAPAATAVPGATAVPTGANATVTGAFRLNVRQTPSLTGARLVTISRNDTYPIVGRTADNRWIQINVNGTVGWVSGPYVTSTNLATVPVGGGGNVVVTPGATTGVTLTGQFVLNIRSGPGTTNSILGKLPSNTAATVIGRNASGTWYQINYAGITGWVVAIYSQFPAGTNLNNIPVTG